VGGKTILDDYLRVVRPLFAPPRTFQRTIYRPGEICQFDLWEPKAEVPVGHGQTRRGWVVVACLGYSRAGAGALIFSTRTPDLLAGIRRCLWSLGALSQTLVWDRQSGLHAGAGRPTEAFAAFCGQLRVGRHLCDACDPQAKGCVERLQEFIETSFEPGRRFANELDFQAQLDTWFSERANPRMDKTLRCRPSDRLAEERHVMAPLPATPPDTDRRWVLRVPPDPYLRFDTCATRWTPVWSAGASRRASPSGSCWPSPWTPASWPANTPAASRASGRSPRSSTPARSRTNASNGAAHASRWSRSSRWPTTTP
jgi:hypothetical protein